MYQEPDYNSYSLQELYEADEGINEELYAERARKIQELIELREQDPNNEDRKTLEAKILHIKKEQAHKTNWKGSLISAILIIVILSFSLITGEFYLREGEVTYEDSPFLFILLIVVYVFSCFYAVYQAEEKYSNWKNRDKKL